VVGEHVTVKSSSVHEVRWQQSLMVLTAWLAPVFFSVLVMTPKYARAQNAPYVILGKRAILLQDVCEANKNATLTPVGATEGGLTASVISLRESPALPPNWTLVLVTGSDLQADKKYFLAFDGLKVPGKSTCAEKGPWTIDTTAQVTYQPKNNGTGTLVSNVAFSYLNGSPPLQLGNSDLCKSITTASQCRTVTLDLGGVKYPLRTVAFQEINLADIAKSGLIATPDSIGVIPIDSNAIQPLVGESTVGLGKAGTLFGISNVLAAGSTNHGLKLKVGAFTAAKAPATKDAAWLWISGSLTAGTGAAPAWVMDGKIDIPPVYERGPFQLRVATATANIGNNKVDGQAAKDVIDFSAPSARWIFEAKKTGLSLNLAPTYETNRALTHRNMLVTGDFAISPNGLDNTQAVRIAKKYFQIRDDEAGNPKGVNKNRSTCGRTTPVSKMPEQGDFSDCRFPRAGWRLNLHPGIEAGAALEPVTVKNPTTKVVVGTVPTYGISRAVLELDGLYQYRNFSLEDYVTGRYLFTTEHTAVNDRHGNPYLETVTGGKAVNVVTVTYSPESEKHIKITLAYTNGFSAPVYQRANGIRLGLGVAY